MVDNDVLETVTQTVNRHELLRPGDKVVVAVSGGPDSLCLLHVLCALRQTLGVDLHVAHLDHCLRGVDSEADAVFVKGIASAWGLPITTRSADVQSLTQQEKGSLEEVARRARYRFLGSVASEVGAQSVAVGHNADDQTETVLMHWLRGAGLAGLRGMRPSSPLGMFRLGETVHITSGLQLIRPLLYVSRSEIEGYCNEHGLQARFDRSNLDTTYLRNRLRHELIPYLETYNPNIRELLRRSAEALSGDFDVISSQVDRSWARVVRESSGTWVTLDLARWRRLQIGLQRSVLRRAVQTIRRHLRDIAWEHVENAVWVGRERETGTQATLPGGLVLTVGYDELVISEAGSDTHKMPPFPWITEGPVDVLLPGSTPLYGSTWRVEASFLDATPDRVESAGLNNDPNQAYLDAGKVTGLLLRPRQAGDRFQPLGMAGSHQTLREFMINAKIPARWRDLVPIGVCENRVAWVAGWRMDERFKVQPGTQRILHLALVEDL